MLRAARRDGVPLRRRGGVAYPADPDALTTPSGASTSSCGTTRAARSRALGPRGGLPALVQRRARHRHRRDQVADERRSRRLAPADGRQPDRSARSVGVHVRRRPLEGFAGDTLASALLAAACGVVGRSIYSGRPRGSSAGAEEPNAWVQVTWPRPGADGAGHARAVDDGLAASRWPGAAGWAPSRRRRSPTTRCTPTATCSSSAAAGRAAGRRRRARSSPAGRGSSSVDADPTGEPTWVTPTPTASRLYDHGTLVAVERRRPGDRADGLRPCRPGALVTRHRRRRAADRLRRQRPARRDAGRRGRRTSSATACCRAGARSSSRPTMPACRAADRSPPPASRSRAVLDVRADRGGHGDAATAPGALEAVGSAGSTVRPATIEADLLAVSGGWTRRRPAPAARGRLRFDGGSRPVVPDPTGPDPLGPDGGRRFVRPGDRGARRRATGSRAGWRPDAGGRRRRPNAARRRAPGRATSSTQPRRHRARPAARRRRRARHVEHVKRYTTIGTGADQGRTPRSTPPRSRGVIGLPLGALGPRPTGRRPSPSPFAVLAGRDRGPRSPTPCAPRRSMPGTSRTAPCSRTSGSGSGPATTRAPASTWTTRCPRVRRGRARGRRDDGRLHARQDRRPGPRRGVLLDRVYTNRSATLAVGRCRYGVMCRPTAWCSTTASRPRLAETAS